MVRNAVGSQLPLTQMFRLNLLYDSPRLRRSFNADPLRLRAYDADAYLNYLTYLPAAHPSQLKIPILLMIGDRDRLVPLAYEQRVYQSLQAEYPATEMQILPGGSHGLFEEKTSQAAQAAAGWLAKAFLAPSRPNPYKRVERRRLPSDSLAHEISSAIA